MGKKFEKAQQGYHRKKKEMIAYKMRTMRHKYQRQTLIKVLNKLTIKHSQFQKKENNNKILEVLQEATNY